jgi:hypothetical protein
MSLIGRVLVIVLALLLAGMMAAFVIAFGILMEWQELFAGGGEAGWLAFGVFGLISSMKGLLPALLVIAIAEALSIRASLFYAVVGGLGLVGLYYGLGLAEREPDLLIRRDLEIMAGAGIAAGFVYWIIAGRKAGAWRAPKAAPVEKR